MTVLKLKKIQRYWTVLASTMYDLLSGHKTKLVTKSIEYDLKVYLKRYLPIKHWPKIHEKSGFALSSLKGVLGGGKTIYEI